MPCNRPLFEEEVVSETLHLMCAFSALQNGFLRIVNYLATYDWKGHIYKYLKKDFDLICHT